MKHEFGGAGLVFLLYWGIAIVIAAAFVILR